jgi:hypothetical protein
MQGMFFSILQMRLKKDTDLPKVSQMRRVNLFSSMAKTMDYFSEE